MTPNVFARKKVKWNVCGRKQQSQKLLGWNPAYGGLDGLKAGFKGDN
jgi:D-alanyl-D-alanine carboxypeptidase